MEIITSGVAAAAGAASWLPAPRANSAHASSRTVTRVLLPLRTEAAQIRADMNRHLPEVRWIISLLPLAVLPAWSPPASAAQMHSLVVRVTAVADGDTITVLDPDQRQRRVRLAGIDAPEHRQPYADRSRQNLVRLVHRKTVRLEWSKVDQYGRLVAKILLDPGADCGRSCAPMNVNLEQVRAGLAWHYKQYEGEQ